MTGVIRKATLLVALGLVVASAAMAGVPSPANSTIPAFVNLVACSGTGSLPPAARYLSTITVRDLGNFPLSGVEISLRFCTDVKIYQTIPGGTVVQPVYTYSTLTDVNGQATVEISGAGFNTNGSTVGTNGSACVGWYADGTFLGGSHVATYDEDGASAIAKQGVLGADLSAWVSDFTALPAVYKPRSDFNNLGTLDGGDLSFWITYFTALPAFVSSCGAL